MKSIQFNTMAVLVHPNRTPHVIDSIKQELNKRIESRIFSLNDWTDGYHPSRLLKMLEFVSVENGYLHIKGKVPEFSHDEYGQVEIPNSPDMFGQESLCVVLSKIMYEDFRDTAGSNTAIWYIPYAGHNTDDRVSDSIIAGTMAVSPQRRYGVFPVQSSYREIAKRLDGFT